jgi:hypothetical protein
MYYHATPSLLQLGTVLAIARLLGVASAVCTGWNQNSTHIYNQSHFSDGYTIPVDSFVCPPDAATDCSFDRKAYVITDERKLSTNTAPINLAGSKPIDGRCNTDRSECIVCAEERRELSLPAAAGGLKTMGYGRMATHRPGGVLPGGHSPSGLPLDLAKRARTKLSIPEKGVHYSPNFSHVRL